MQQLGYSYDANGNIILIEDFHGQEQSSFAYDALNRLGGMTVTDAQQPPTTVHSEGFGYDTAGRMVSKSMGQSASSFTYDADHPHAVSTMVVDSVSQNYSYDANGNQVQRNLDSGEYTLSYDAENRLVAVTVTNQPVPTQTPTPTETQTPTQTQEHTQTTTPTQTQTGTPAQSQTPTATATATATETETQTTGRLDGGYKMLAAPRRQEGTATPTATATATETQPASTATETATATASATATPTPLSAGQYENDYSGLAYSGNWTTWTGSGPSGGSNRYSDTIGSAVEVTFASSSNAGKQIQLLYTGYSNRGEMEVYIDNTLVDTIDQYSQAVTWQNAWYSPVWKDNDPHTIRLVHASGQIADIDAIIFHDDIEIMGEGTYDNTDTRVFCDGSWVNYPLTNAYQGSTLYSETVGNTASFLFNGRQLSLLYTGYYTRGEMLIQIDGQTIDLLNQFTLDVTYQNRWDGPVLPPGEHTVTLTHVSGQVVDLDAIIISNADPLSAGTYDDDHEDVQYSGDWTEYDNVRAYTGDSRYSDTIGDAVNFSFTGTRLSLLYTGLTNRGNMQVYIDGTLEDTINQYTASTTWQNRWDSDEFTPGLHTVRLRHASGQIVDLDGILIDGVNPLPAGTHDDTDSRIHFGGNWTAYSHANAHDGGSRYSESVGDTVSFYFTGTQLSLVYTGLTNRGNMQVYIDGALVGTINQYSSTLTWKKRWNSPTLSPGQHKVRLVHASGAINDLDAIIVTDSTATATPTTTPNLTPTVTPTITGTLTGTPIPTETPPPPLQSAEYVYDGDGNMVKGVVNGVKTYYPGRHYNEVVDGSTSTVKKFYTMGSTTVAVRTVSGTENVLNWILGDHLGSASVTANADGSWNSEIKYTAFGEVRASSGLTPTEYRYTNQLYQNSLGLSYYVARWYDPSLAHFVQADTIVPKAGNSTAFDRYAYVEWNPTNKCDPSGHCSLSSASLMMPWGIFMFYAGCAQDLKDTYDTYQAGEKRLGALYLEATGLKDLAVSTAERVQDLNTDKDTVFSDAPLNERALPSVRLGTWAVSTAANVVGTAQAIRAGLAFSRSGTGGSDYFVKGTLSERTFGPDDDLYRVYDGANSLQEGSWGYLNNPGNRITAIRKGALPTGNDANFMTRVTFNAPVTAEVSIAAPLYHQPGGAAQVKLPYSPKNISFSPGKSLPIGIMPFVPQRLLSTWYERLK